MAAVLQSSGDDARILQAIDDWTSAVERKDIDGMVKHYSEQFVGFDMVPPLAHRGAAAYRKVIEDWLGSLEGPPKYDRRDLQIASAGDVGFAHGLFNIRAKLKDGGPVDYWIRVTLGLRKQGREWKVVHEHASVPFDMKTTKAMLDLKP